MIYESRIVKGYSNHIPNYELNFMQQSMNIKTKDAI